MFEILLVIVIVGVSLAGFAGYWFPEQSTDVVFWIRDLIARAFGRK